MKNGGATVDGYTKVVLTVIALALVMLALRPLVQPSRAAADGPVDVTIIGVRMDSLAANYAPLPVNCMRGCKTN